MSYETLIVDRDGAVATMTINRPKVLNALNQRTIDELEERLRQELSRSEQLVTKLQENSSLLLNIHKELDRALQQQS